MIKNSSRDDFLIAVIKGTDRHPESSLANIGFRQWNGQVALWFLGIFPGEKIPADEILLNQIYSVDRAKGHGTACLKWLTELADHFKTKIIVMPEPVRYTMSTEKLVAWYCKHGFKPHPSIKKGSLLYTPR